ncbi:MAG: DNA-binding response regulator [Archangiaceae bacterium]|nr:DNA-binding response regulator [Archangiaceae bacterium]
MPSDLRKLSAILVGDADSFHALLVDVLRDLRVEVQLVRVGAGKPDLVFAMIRQGDVFRVLDLAKRAAAGAPIVAVLALNDARLAQRAVLGGAKTVCSLDRPLDGLRLAFSEALSLRASALDGNPTLQGRAR